MSENSKIEWTDHTFNPWEGCQQVGPGCDHCYTETRNARFAGGIAINWGPGAPRRRTSAANWRKPLAWNAAHPEFSAAHGRRQRVFCASLADVFDNAVDLLWRRDLFRLIADTPNLDWLLLTKRIGNVSTMLRHIGVERLPENVWLGATIVNQEEANRDIPKLLSVPARVRFLSMEPLLGPVDLTRLPHGDESDLDVLRGQVVYTSQHFAVPPDPLGKLISWVIVGGESGPGARPMHPGWARSLRDQCEEAGVPFLFKQWGEWRLMSADEQRANPASVTRGHVSSWPDGTLGRGDFGSNGGYGKPLFLMGKKAAGRLLGGRTHDEFPEGR
ncbi:phage Gp37/Gp68 family protein [Paraburkholderia youngii]|uniref:Phage Gp37/Gp68 family protein n=1 Tax=Paraburkholderia youngii TaxID=2782701 RepID=A0ABX2NPJ5_9BURK|nr:phage Gp37/Gp68 family protein [Paraburkholderia youngii]NVI06386.1 phage Gp37/Gp68 family protein [Paraburkholderia youngii]